MLAVWPYGTHGHVGFVEEISADKTQYRLSDFNRGDDEIYRSVWYQFEGTSDFLLGGYPSFYQLPLGTSSPYQGYHDGVDCNNIYGRAWNSTQPGSTVNVNIDDDGNNLLAANVPANQFRSDLPGGGFSAFNYPTPAFLKNGQSHSIRRRLLNQQSRPQQHPQVVYLQLWWVHWNEGDDAESRQRFHLRFLFGDLYLEQRQQRHSVLALRRQLAGVLKIYTVLIKAPVCRLTSVTSRLTVETST